MFCGASSPCPSTEPPAYREPQAFPGVSLVVIPVVVVISLGFGGRNGFLNLQCYCACISLFQTCLLLCKFILWIQFSTSRLKFQVFSHLFFLKVP